MEPSEPSKDELTFSILVPENTVSPCDIMTGVLSISILKQCPCSALELRCKIVEKAEWQEYAVGSTSIMQSKKLHYDTTYTIKSFAEKTLAIGTHVYPFSLPLPKLPDGTFRFLSGSHKAKIDCKLIGILRMDALIIKTAKKHQDVRSTLAAPEASKVQVETNVKMSIHSKGKSRMTAALRATEAASGGKIGILCRIDNSDCRINLREVRARLVQKVQLTTTSGGSRKIEKVVIEKSFPGMPMGKMDTEMKVLEFDVPANLSCSIKGELVSCEYGVQIIGAFDGAFTNSTNICLPVLVRQNKVEGKEGPKFPPSAHIEKVMNLSALQPPSEDKVNPLALVPVKNACKQLMVIPGQKQ